MLCFQPTESALFCLHVYRFRAFYWGVGSLSNTTHLEKTDAPFPSSHPLLMALQLWMGLHEPFPHLCQKCGLAWSCTDLVPAVTVAVCSCMLQPCCVWQILFQYTCLPALDLTVFLLHLQRLFLDPGKEGVCTLYLNQTIICCILVVGLHINWHILPIGVSMSKTERCSDGWVKI